MCSITVCPFHTLQPVCHNRIKHMKYINRQDDNATLEGNPFPIFGIYKPNVMWYGMFLTNNDLLQ